MIIDPKVPNLSTINLTPLKIQILSKALKLTPTTYRNLPEVEKDIKDLFRKLRSAEFFSENPKVDTSDSSLVQ